MSLQLIQIDPAAITVNENELHYLLSPSASLEDPYIKEKLSDYSVKCLNIIRPKATVYWSEAENYSSKGMIRSEGILFNVGRTISKMLQRSIKFAFFIATAGPGPEELARSLMQDGQYLEGYVVDLIASSLVEATAQYVHDQIGEEAKKAGHKITNRYSPGYCGWEVQEQQKLFSLFPEGSCGIVLSESSLMSPIKSVSGVVGAGPAVSFRDYTCELCSMKDCSFRRTRPTQGSISR